MIRLALAALAASLCSTAQAQAWPTKPIRLLVPFAPGGTSSIVARSIGAEMEKGLGQPIIIDNRPGGGGNVAMQEAARADPDGYTLIIGHIGTLAVNPFMFDKLPFDTNADFAAVSLLAKVPSIFVVHADVPAKDLREFVALAKSKPGQLYYGSAGNGSAGHLAIEYLKLVAGIDIVHVPFKGGGPAMTDLMGGQVPMLFSSLGPAVGAVKSGKIRALAVTSLTRSAAFPDVPTMDELGFKGFDSTAWYGLLGPAGLPQEAVSRLTQALAKAGTDRELVGRINATGCDTGILPPAQTVEKIKADYVKWGRVVKEASIKAE